MRQPHNRQRQSSGLHATSATSISSAATCDRKITEAAKDAQFTIWLNIITPFMPIISDGKEPDLQPFLDEIRQAVGKAVHKAHRPRQRGMSQKQVILDHLDDVIAESAATASTGSTRDSCSTRCARSSWTAFKKELQIGNFTAGHHRIREPITAISPACIVSREARSPIRIAVRHSLSAH